MSEGGHDVPAETVVRRYHVGLVHLRRWYLPALDLAFIYDNADGRGILIAEKTAAGEIVVHEREVWRAIMGIER